jgi:hypothetical protein
MLMIRSILKGRRAGLVWVGLSAALLEFPAQARAARPAGTVSAQKSATSSNQSAGSHKGMVWVNPKTKIFHRPGDRWYGKSKGGKYMTEADAIKAGYKPAKPRHPLPTEKKKQNPN